MPLLLPKLRPDQAKIVNHPARIKVVNMGRRWGKTVTAGSTALACASQRAAVAWIVPTYKNARPVWRFAQQMIKPVYNEMRVSQSERIMEFPGGGWLGVYTADNPVGILGEAFDVVVCEEAARFDEPVWNETILPTLADRDGRALLISTPRGMNWYFTEFQNGLDDGKFQASFTAPTSANPNQNIQRAFNRVRELADSGRYSLRSFRQEWLAEFQKDGAYFQNIDNSAVLEHPDRPEQHRDHRLVIGADWGKYNDYTTIRVGCRECCRVVDWYRFNQIDYRIQRGRLIDVMDMWGKPYTLVEQNSIGDVNIEELQYAGYTVEGFQTTAVSKPILIEGLNKAFVMDGFKVPLSDRNELLMYEIISNSGRTKFGAPSGMNDDCVIGDALCWRAMTQAQPIMY